MVLLQVPNVKPNINIKTHFKTQLALNHIEKIRDWSFPKYAQNNLPNIRIQLNKHKKLFLPH